MSVIGHRFDKIGSLPNITKWNPYVYTQRL
jgi:hypothetical protein